MLGEDPADRPVVGRQGVLVALEEARQQRRHEHAQEAVRLGRGAVEPLQPRQVGSLPARRMQPRHLLEDGGCHVRAAGRDLVALRSADDVLEEKGEPPRRGLHLGHVGHRQARTDAGGDLAVEPDLYLVGPERQAGAAALLVGRGELAHHAARTGTRRVVHDGEARRVGHLARADRLGLEGGHPGTTGQHARGAERVGQPPRRDVGGVAQERRRRGMGGRHYWLGPSGSCSGDARHPRGGDRRLTAAGNLR